MLRSGKLVNFKIITMEKEHILELPETKLKELKEKNHKYPITLAELNQNPNHEFWQEERE